MRAKPTLARPQLAATVIATACAMLFAIAVLEGVEGLFHRDGAPFEQLVVAERACASHRFVSERESCMRSYFITSQTIASR